MGEKLTTDCVYKIGVVGNTVKLSKDYPDNLIFCQNDVNDMVNFKNKNIKIGDKVITLQLCYISMSFGHKKLKYYIKRYFQNCNAILFLYDINNLQSFMEVLFWNQIINENLSTPNLSKVLLGNKCNITDRQISTKEGQDLADYLKMNLFTETSATVNTKIEELFFYRLAHLIYAKQNKNQNTENLNMFKIMVHP